MILPALQRGGYSFSVQQHIGDRLGGGKHFVDAVAEKSGRQILISMKWQQVSGTAEQKVPYEAICLAEAVRQGPYTKAYLVLGGNGWKLRSFYTGGGLKSYLVDIGKVEIISLEDFIAIANQGCL
jgi:hypothetical protein